MNNKNTRRGFTQTCSLLHLREKVAEGRMRGHLSAFTLIELLVVVLIIGILAAVAVPQYKVAVAKARASTTLSFMKSLLNAQELYYLEHGTYSSDLQNLDITIPADCFFTVSTGMNFQCGKYFFGGANMHTHDRVFLYYCPDNNVDYTKCRAAADFEIVATVNHPYYDGNKPYAGTLQCDALTTLGEKICSSLLP